MKNISVLCKMSCFFPPLREMCHWHSAVSCILRGFQQWAESLNERNMEEWQGEKKLALKCRLFPAAISLQWHSSWVGSSWPQMYLCQVHVPLFSGNSCTCSFWRGKDDACHDKQKDKRQRWIHLYFYIYIWFSILRAENSTISPSNPPTSWGRINSGGIGGLVWTKTLWGYLSSTVWSGSVRPSSEITVKSQGGCDLNIKCSACWKHNKPVYIFVPFSLF